METGRNTIPIADPKFGGGGAVDPAIGLPETLYFAWGATR
jgi:hypothetical protein